MGRDKQVDPQVSAARINGRFLVIAAAVTAVLGLAGAFIATSGHGSAAAPPTVIHARSGCSTPTLTVTSPVSGADVTGRDGVRVLGTACGLAGDDGWLFDHDDEDPYYYEVFPDDPGPVVTRSGPWTTIDQPIGGPGDNDKTYHLTLVLASPACDHALRALRPVDGDYKTEGFPAGCQVVRPEVAVSVTY